MNLTIKLEKYGLKSEVKENFLKIRWDNVRRNPAREYILGSAID